MRLKMNFYLEKKKKKLLLSMAFIHFFSFPGHFFFLEYGLKKYKEHHVIILPIEKKLIHTVSIHLILC